MWTEEGRHKISKTQIDSSLFKTDAVITVQLCSFVVFHLIISWSENNPGGLSQFLSHR